MYVHTYVPIYTYTCEGCLSYYTPISHSRINYIAYRVYLRIYCVQPNIIVVYSVYIYRYTPEIGFASEMSIFRVAARAEKVLHVSIGIVSRSCVIEIFSFADDSTRSLGIGDFWKIMNFMYYIVYTYTDENSSLSLFSLTGVSTFFARNSWRACVLWYSSNAAASEVRMFTTSDVYTLTTFKKMNFKNH